MFRNTQSLQNALTFYRSFGLSANLEESDVLNSAILMEKYVVIFVRLVAAEKHVDSSRRPTALRVCCNERE